MGRRSDDDQREGIIVAWNGESATAVSAAAGSNDSDKKDNRLKGAATRQLVALERGEDGGEEE